MIYSICGVLIKKGNNFAAVEVGGIGYKIYTSEATLKSLVKEKQEVCFFCYTHVREDALDLYGFLTEKELLLFESLIGVSGVGPRSGLNIMAVASISQLIAAINEGRADLLSKAGGVGRKTAERITLELKGKLAFSDSEKSINMMESDIDLEETLVGLGFSRANARNAISKIGSEITDFNERLKIALKHK